MQKTIYIVQVMLLSFGYSVSYAQYFEGRIYYDQSYISKNDKVSSEMLLEYMGDSHDYTYSKGNYKSVVNGVLGNTLLYIADSNKVYNYPLNMDSLSVTDVSQYDGVLQSIELNKKVLKVLDYWCDEVIIISSKTKMRYYFNEELKLDSSKFINHKYSHWDEYTRISGSIALKYILEFDEFEVIGEAIKIVPSTLSSDEFTIPSSLLLKN